MIVSVIVCTYNRADMLSGCLASIACQTAPGESFEVIVVDNNSSDDTSCIVQGFLKNPNMRYVTESNAGLSHARNKGLAEAKGEYIAFLDDDVLVPSQWVEKVILHIEKYPHLDGCGGPLYPFYTTPKPDWYEDAYDAQMSKKGIYFLEPGHGFIGANMIWDRKLLESIGGFRHEFGLMGDSLKYIGLGEETDAYQRAWQVKPSARFLFLPGLWVKHWVPPWKMVLAYRLRRLFFTGFYDYQISGPRPFFSRVSYFLGITFDLLKTVVKAGLVVWKYSHWKKWGYCELSPLAIDFGKIYAAIGLKVSRGR